jgi:hypothetical protein
MAVFSIFNEVNNSTGLPISTTFSVPSNFPSSQLLLVAGSAWSNTANVPITVQVVIESQVVGTMTLFSNGTATHRAFGTAMIPLQLNPGQTGVTLTLQDLDGSPTITDQNDWFSAALIG